MTRGARTRRRCFVYGGYNFGNCTYKNDIPRAIAEGLTDEETVDRAVRRVLWNLFKGGIYDKADANMAWAGLGADDIGSPTSAAMNHEMALQGITLLKNDVATGTAKKVLPLDPGKRTLMVGPMVGSSALDGGYEFDDGASSIGSGLSHAANWTHLTSATGCQVSWTRDGDAVIRLCGARRSQFRPSTCSSHPSHLKVYPHARCPLAAGDMPKPRQEQLL